MIFASLFFCAIVTVAQSQSTLPHLTIMDVALIDEALEFQISPCGWSYYCFFCANSNSTTKDNFFALNNATFPSLYNNIATNACSNPSTPGFAVTATTRNMFNTILMYWCQPPYATCDHIQPNPNILSTYASCAIGAAVRSDPYHPSALGMCDYSGADIAIVASKAGFDPSFISKFISSADSVCKANGNNTHALNEYDVATKTVCTDSTITCESVCPLTPHKG